jgi:hypothetical protein
MQKKVIKEQKEEQGKSDDFKGNEDSQMGTFLVETCLGVQVSGHFRYKGQRPSGCGNVLVQLHKKHAQTSLFIYFHSMLFASCI